MENEQPFYARVRREEVFSVDVSVLKPMIYSIFKNQVFIRNGSWIPPTCAKNASFLRIISALVVRYESGIAESRHWFKTSYLINTIGLSPQSAVSVSKKLHFETSKQPDTIRNIIQRWPESLLCNPEKTLLPKLQFFYSRRISRFQLLRILAVNPSVFRTSLDNSIIPNFNSFKEFTRCDDDQVFLAYKNDSSILTRKFQSVFAPNLAILKESGVPESTIIVELVLHPRIFSVKPDKFRGIVEEVKKLGFDPSKRSFLTAVQAFLQLSKSTWERKIDLLKQWGWSNEEVVSAFEKYPKTMMFSEQKISAIMSLFVDTMGWKSSYIAKRPVLLAYNLERRIIPRCLVLQALLSKGLIQKFSLNLLVESTEKKFLQRFVIPYKDPYLLKLYEQKLGLPE
ncbi:hypothetical protein GOBAR_AA00359 [Gossypium barbadense]|uniref:Uncharacterized protein n=1 Tax=Gossypium barbadense TaxID=3634 RepID=A0A2P5YXG3_GOSBA|nr:hypothetical protein GOBAR_AA00359 [Gossypium barbadense]